MHKRELPGGSLLTVSLLLYETNPTPVRRANMQFFHLISAFIQETHWFFISHANVQDMFLNMPPILEKMLRSLIIYVFLVAGLRVAGKRELAQLNPFDLVVLLLLSNTVQNAIIGNDNSVTGGIIGAATLLAVNYFVVRFIFKHKRLDRIVEGNPTTLIEHGKIIEENLAKELLTENELLTVAHRQGFSRLGEVDKAVLDPGGFFYMEGKVPPLGQRQHAEILKRLDALRQQIEALQAKQG
jgi:hypothetical protein